MSAAILQYTHATRVPVQEDVRRRHACHYSIVFRHSESSIGAVTDAKQRPGFPLDPPWNNADNIAGAA
ncbi:MAG: hypothetical protein DME59_09965 [Verrucomicrobia bacterium]|nr:MAG: hypothetical protein DME59_09965 [Verrucomicrobiota bacterium]